MSSLIKSSIGNKLIMSLSGIFLMTFLIVHLSVNITLILDDSGMLFNQAANFMTTNPLIRLIEPVLGIGFLVHIFLSVYITWKNRQARPVGYAGGKSTPTIMWPSKNMFLLGALILAFLVVHIINFYWKLRVTHEGVEYLTLENGDELKNAYAIVAGLFKASLTYCIIYIVSIVLLGLHLGHGFWSSFQTLGWTNNVWINRLKTIGIIFAVTISAGFIAIPVYFIIAF